jgi:hypothetical protein
MKRLIPAIACLLVVVPMLQAQVTVEMMLPQDKFLPAEELLAGVRVVNRSGQPLKLGEDADWIQFYITPSEGGTVPKKINPPVQKPFELASSKQATLKVDLAPCFDLRKQGSYRIYAVVKIKDWNQTLTTKEKSFEIIEGTKLWEESVGVPRLDGSGPPEVRKYVLQQANYLDELRLYLRVNRASGDPIRVVNLGRMLSVGRPEPLLDSVNHLHLLQQVGARSSQYLVFNTDGDLLIRQTYEYDGTRPRLQRDEKGDIEVKGGFRRLAVNDLPPEPEATSNAEPPKTN